MYQHLEPGFIVVPTKSLFKSAKRQRRIIGKLMIKKLWYGT